MLENMTTEEKVIAGITAVGIAALVFHKPTRNAVGLSDGRKAAPFIRKIADLATNNYHTEARLELAKKYGTKDIVGKYKEIKMKADKAGGLSNTLYNQRAALDRRMINIAEGRMTERDFNDLLEAFDQ
jgi:hypothetical protein